MASDLAKPITLKCGLNLPNRLMKAAMAEVMADRDYYPGELFQRAYGKWAEGGWGMVLLGNVQVDRAYLGSPRDVSVDPENEEKTIKLWSEWAAACKAHDTPTIMQINHPGKQSPTGAGKRPFSAKTISPSAIPLNMGSGMIARAVTALMFGTPREMTAEDIQTVVQQFVYTAKLASKAGFDGIQVHAAHGYLLAQFLSPDSNHRTDAYGGSPKGRAQIILDIINAIRKEVPPTFCVGIKINSVDHQSADRLDGFLEQLQFIVDAGVDFIEISGGTYEDPQMARGIDQPTPEKSARTLAREAFFLDFAEAIRGKFPEEVLVVTGGFRSRAGMRKALQDGACDMIGLGRPAVLKPTLPKDIILNEEIPDEEAKVEAVKVDAPIATAITGVKALGSGAETAWYSGQIQKMASL